MSKVVLSVGVSASGKTYWARQQVADNPNAVIVCRDDIRAAQGFPPLGDQKQEKIVTKLQRGMIEAALLDGFDVYVADTNIHKHIRNGLIRFAHKHGADVEVVVFDVDLDTCIERDSKREKSVGESVIRKQHSRLSGQDIRSETIPVQTFSKIEKRDHLPSAVVVDIDGTVARHTHRSPYDYSMVHTDEPIENVVEVIERLQATGVQVVFMSGRKSDCFEETKAWLHDHFPFEWLLFMRDYKDDRPDWIVKGELWDEHVIPNYDVLVAFDDRDSVVKHLRTRGVTVAQVAYGRF